MNKTGIEYLDYTWNPLAMRCTKISEGCANCWHLRTADRLAKNTTLTELQRNAYSGSGTTLLEEELKAPLHRKKPAVIGVQFMGDLFHESVSVAVIYEVFQVMERCPQHTFLVLTKRPERMRQMVMGVVTGHAAEHRKHIWLGVTAENQARADERISILLQIPAAARFLSVEPMLGPIDLTKEGTGYSTKSRPALEPKDCQVPGDITPMLDWVICGGETGKNARPMHPDWVRGLRDQCKAARVPFFIKQWGEWLHDSQVPDCKTDLDPDYLAQCHSRLHSATSSDRSYLIGKKATGHLLDGQEWRQMPERSR